MKIGINDGCANGGMMDSLSIRPLKEGQKSAAYAICEVDEVIWHNWQVFLKEHNKWEVFWDKQLLDPKNRNK